MLLEGKEKEINIKFQKKIIKNNNVEEEMVMIRGINTRNSIWLKKKTKKRGK